MKGKLPETGFITLESDEASWLMLINGIINEMKITALVDYEPGRKVRIKLIINQIFSPDMVTAIHSYSCRGDVSGSLSVGLIRLWEFFTNYLQKNTWIFMGYIEGGEKVPILIYYYKSVGMAIYTQKLKTDDNANFFPNHLNN